MRSILNLSDSEREHWRQEWLGLQVNDTPIMVAYGGGVDSTAMLLALHELGIRPDAILFADVGDEKKETYEFINGPMREHLIKIGFPPVQVVRYIPQDFKHWPPYFSLSENCLTNSTLPSLAFGFKSCSQKWKVSPQDKWTDLWDPAITAWAKGKKVTKLIGYDAGPKDIRRRNHAGNSNDPKYDYVYPLINWTWDRELCKAYIESRGLPVPPKSACIMCPATRPEELHDYPVENLQKLVIIEARAHDRLMGNWSEEQMEAYNRGRWAEWKGANVFRPSYEIWMDSINPKKSRKYAWEFIPAPGFEVEIASGRVKPKYPKPLTVAQGVTGLWRARSKKSTGRITDYIREQALLPAEEIDRLIADTPREPLSAEQLTAWSDFIERIANPSTGCSSCACCSH